MPIGADWLSPDTSRNDASVSASRRTTSNAVALLPDRSVALTWIVLGPGSRGMFGTRKLRFDTCASTPLTVTLACSSLTVPTTMSFTVPVTVTCPSVVADPSPGDVIASFGGVVSSEVWMLDVLMVPPLLVATAVMVLRPSCRGTDALNDPLPTVAAMPLILTVASGSPTVPLTMIGATLMNERFAGLRIEMSVAVVPVMSTTSGGDSTGIAPPLNCADTRNVTGPGTVSNTGRFIENTRLPATASPLSPSSCSVPGTGVTRPAASIRWRMMVSGSTAGSMIAAVTFTTAATPTGVDAGSSSVSPIEPGDPEGIVSSRTVTLAVREAPAALVATAVMVLLPSNSATSPANVPPSTVAGTSLISTVATGPVI